MAFHELMDKWDFRPIRRCPGRYVLSPAQYSGSPQNLVEAALEIHEFRGVARDTVIVAPFAEGGGLISYRQKDGRHVHTLNTDEGFRRKLSQMGITWSSSKPAPARRSDEAPPSGEDAG